VEEAEADVVKAERALADGSAAAAAEHVRRALAVLTLPVLPGVEGAWADATRDRYRDLRVRAAEIHSTASLSEARYGHAVEAAAGAVELAPFRESAHRLLMRAHAASGNRAEGLRAYSRCRQLLLEELGISP